MFHHTGLNHMTISRPVNSQDLMFKLSEVLFSSEVEPFIQVLNKTEAEANFEIGVSLEDFRKMTDAEQNAVLDKVTERTKNKVKEGKVEFIMDGQHYELRHNTQENSIFLSHYKNKEENTVEVQDILKKAVAKDKDTFLQDLVQVSHDCPADQFVEDRDSTYYREPFYNNIIASRTFQSVSIYLSNEALKVFEKLKPLFTPEEQVAIESRITTKFAIHTQRFADEMIEFFMNWIPKLQEGQYTEAKPMVFNDLDNHAYCVNNAQFVMIVQESQNTIFAYVFNKETLQIKVWTCADVTNNDCEYEMNRYATYQDVMKEMGNPYSYYNFPTEMLGVSYPKSAQYFLNHFEDESEFLVFDSNKGFRVNTFYSDCMATDVPLLNRVVDELPEEDEEEVED